VIQVPDYKELYFNLFRATEQAINLLITAQQACEEEYLRQGEEEAKTLTLLPEQEQKNPGPF
jgi:hypothetical protein